MVRGHRVAVLMLCVHVDNSCSRRDGELKNTVDEVREEGPEVSYNEIDYGPLVKRSYLIFLTEPNKDLSWRRSTSERC